MEQAIGFDELRWLQELRLEKQNKALPESIEVLLMRRGLIERTVRGLTLTERGRIALAKLG